jgi:beta-lactamase superfamily II metal-dependent hydrolase
MENQGVVADSASDAAIQGTYHFLDVGGSLYGDCILIEFGAIRVLIDGSHVEDFDGQAGHLPIPDQIKAILGGTPPYDVDLLVVTHGHADHIGCLPQLVSNAIVKPKFALVTDPALGFGRINDSDAVADLSLDDQLATIAAAMREEDASFLNDEDLEAFLDAAGGVEVRYKTFLADLAAKGTTVIVYQGDPLPQALIDLMEPTGMILLGPTRAQLELCAAQIGATNKDASDFASDASSADAEASRADLYRQVAANIDAADGAGGRGAGMNCQSITLAFGQPGERALLAGDMQFARPDVSGVDELMPALRAAVAAHGPYALFKTTHHTAHNGQDDALLTELGNPPILVHSGGSKDKSHPNGAVLTSLRKRSNAIRFARTDRNQIISVKPHLGAAAEAIQIRSGALNDFTLNKTGTQRDAKRGEAEPTQAETTSAPLATVRTNIASARSTRTAPQVIIVNLPDGPISMTVGDVPIIVDAIGQSRSAVAPTNPAIASPKTQGDRTPSKPQRLLANGRPLPKLLFVTNGERLAANIGESEAKAALAMIETAGQALISVAPDRAVIDTQAALTADPTIVGVVIVGGYDVVPSYPTDALDADLRKTLAHRVFADEDEYIVWSDEAYGDKDGDLFAEVPVSRIPDARDAALIFAALSADSPIVANRFGIRNFRRPFADQVWTEIPGHRALFESQPFRAEQVIPTDLHNSLTYIMLHGSADDATRFKGEEIQAGSLVDAFTTRDIPSQLTGMAFAGCCWGALTVSERACKFKGDFPSPRVAERSIALSYLKAGGSAFVGSTGAHLSGQRTTFTENPALALHASFWAVAKDVGYAASPALFAARDTFTEFIAQQANGGSPSFIASMLKNRTQFTCLGLGW